MTYYDHNTDPPSAIPARLAPRCTLVRGVSVPPGGELPAGVYRDGGADPVPEGQIIAARRRVVRNGLSVEEHDLADAPPDPLADTRAALVSQIRATLQDAGLADIPADWAAAIAALKALPDRLTALAIGLEILALRIALVEAGGSWAQVLEEGGDP